MAVDVAALRVDCCWWGTETGFRLPLLLVVVLAWWLSRLVVDFGWFLGISSFGLLASAAAFRPSASAPEEEGSIRVVFARGVDAIGPRYLRRASSVGGRLGAVPLGPKAARASPARRLVSAISERG